MLKKKKSLADPCSPLLIPAESYRVPATLAATSIALLIAILTPLLMHPYLNAGLNSQQSNCIFDHLDARF